MGKGILLAALLALALASAVGLSACGGGGESAEDKITSAIETSATSTDPASCEETQTRAFMEQNSGGEGQEALKNCEKDAEEATGNAESVSVSEIEVEGSEASAVANPVGGGLDGQSVTIGLVEEEGAWKLNEFESFAKFNREKLIASFEGLLEENEEVEPELGECVIEGMEELSDGELEEVVLAGEEGIGSIAEECVG